MAATTTMPRRRPPWWMYVIAAVYAFTFLFNARQEALGPANTGWTASWPSLKVARIVPGGLMDRAGLRVGDVLEAVDGRTLSGMPDWFVARAHFERNRPVAIQIRRGEEHLRLELLTIEPGFRTWTRTYYVAVIAFYLARLLLLLLAIFVAWSRPQQVTARWAALMLAIGAVAEGYPSPGWAAALGHLPAVLAMPICLASVSCLLASAVWLPFCASFSGSGISKRWQRGLAVLPVVLFGPAMIASAIAMIYQPSGLAQAWPLVFSSGSMRVAENIVGVVPLLFLNVWPFHGPLLQARLLELWFAVNALYFASGFFMLMANYRRLEDPHQRRRAGALCFAFALFGCIVLHNILMRNWTIWFGGSPPAFFSDVAFAGEAVLFAIVPLTLASCVLAKPHGDDEEMGNAKAQPTVSASPDVMAP